MAVLATAVALAMMAVLATAVALAMMAVLATMVVLAMTTVHATVVVLTAAVMSPVARSASPASWPRCSEVAAVTQAFDTDTWCP